MRCIKTDTKKLLQPYVGKIYVLYVRDEIFPRWKEEREKYIYDGALDRTSNMRQKFPGELIIEFDQKKKEIPEKICRRESVYWIYKLKDMLETEQKKFHIVDHQGISPHLRLNIEGLEKYDKKTRKEYKRLFSKELLNYIRFKPRYVVFDEGFATNECCPVTLENRPHWKNKHKGKICKVIYENSFSPIQVREDKVREIKNSLCTSKVKSSVCYPNNSRTSFRLNYSKFKMVFNHYYNEGYRHYLLLGLTTIFQKRGYSLQDIKDIILPLTVYDPQPNNGDLKTIESEYESDYPIHLKSPVPIMRFAFDDAFEVCQEFESCFTEVKNVSD